jgi:hypothetical protein
MKRAQVSDPEPVIFGVPVEAEGQCESAHALASLISIPAAQSVEVSCAILPPEMSVLFGDSDFFDTIEILAHYDENGCEGCVQAVTASPVALTVASPADVYPLEASTADAHWISAAVVETDENGNADCWDEKHSMCGYYLDDAVDAAASIEAKIDGDISCCGYLVSSCVSACATPFSPLSTGTCVPVAAETETDRKTEEVRRHRLEAIGRWRKKRLLRVSASRSSRSLSTSRRNGPSAGRDRANSVSSVGSTLSRCLGKGIRELKLHVSQSTNCRCPDLAECEERRDAQQHSSAGVETMPGAVEAASDVRPNTSPSSSTAGYFQTGSVSLLSSSVSSEGLMEPLIGQSPFVAASSSQRGYEHPVAHQPMAPAFRADSLEPVAVRPGQHIAGVSSLQTARQQATAKRLRENGRFKKAQTTWVSVTDLFFGS